MAEASSDFLESGQLQRLLDEELANGICTKCGCSDEKKINLVEIDKGALVTKICTNCNHSVGLDDSIDYTELRKQYEERGIASVTPIKCENCENRDIDQFTYLGYVESDGGRVLVQCMQCKESTTVNLHIFSTGGENSETIVEDEGQYSVNPDDVSVSCMLSNSTLDYLNLDLADRSHSVASSKWEYENDHADSTNPALTVYGENATDCSELNCYLYCDLCGISDPDLFSPITIIENAGFFVECLNCNRLLKIPKHFLKIDSEVKQNGNKGQPQKKVCRRADKPGRTQVKELKQLKPGDHVEWHKVYYHHAIVESVDLIKKQFTIIEYTGGPKKVDGHFASVRRNVLNFNDPKASMMFVLKYGEGCALSTAEILQRARMRLGEANYHPIKNNCQHFATWCKTGQSVSDQVDTLKNRLIRTVGTSGLKGAEELVIAGVLAVGKQIPWGQSCKIARCVGLKPARACGEGVVEFSRNLKVGSIALGLGINLAIEGASFGYFLYQAYHDYLNKKISREDFERIRMKLAFESGGGVIGGTIGGILGQLIPVPVLGALVGGTLGNFIGRLLGALLGKKFAERCYKT